MAIIVAPATLYQPGTVVTEDVFGDSDGTIANTALAQTLIFTADPIAVYGDADSLIDTARGGNDSFAIRGRDPLAFTKVVGDAETMFGSSQGGDDQIAGRDNFIAYADPGIMDDQTLGGNDWI